jgi:hypothetical protein
VEDVPGQLVAPVVVANAVRVAVKLVAAELVKLNDGMLFEPLVEVKPPIPDGTAADHEMVALEVLVESVTG